MGRLRWAISAMVLLAGGGCFLRQGFQRPVAVPAPTLERISSEQALAGPQRFSAGMTVTCWRDERGEAHATLQAAGQLKRVAVPARADFYAISNRPEIILMHDRFSPYMDTVRVFIFSPAGAREKVYGHGPHSEAYTVRLYSRFEYGLGRVSVLEELSGGAAGVRPMSRRYEIPLDQ